MGGKKKKKHLKELSAGSSRLEKGGIVDCGQAGKQNKYRFNLSREVATTLPLHALIPRKTGPLGMKSKRDTCAWRLAAD